MTPTTDARLKNHITHKSRECLTCDGCGQIANDEDRTPWRYWLDLPLKSALAVTSGVVGPIACPTCGGTGKKPVTEDTDR